MAIATIKTRLRIFPTPKKARIAKNVRDKEAMSPRREAAKIREKVKRSAANKITKNRGITPNVLGSIK